jgi:hypothetical protein
VFGMQRRQTHAARSVQALELTGMVTMIMLGQGRHGKSRRCRGQNGPAGERHGMISSTRDATLAAA